MKKLKIAFLLSFMILTLTACSNQKPVYTGDSIVVKPAANVKEGTFKLNAISKPASKYEINPKKAKYNTAILSPYAQSFSISKQKVYSDLLSTVAEYGKTYIPSEKIDVDTAKKMMRIIMLDEPRSYALRKQYIYKTDNKGNVKEINLEYSPYLATEEAAQAFKKIALSGFEDKNEDKMIYSIFKNLVNQYKKDDDEAKKLLLEVYKSQLPELEDKTITSAHLEEFIDDIQDTVFATYYLSKPSEEAYCKTFNALLREHSVGALSVYGEKTSSLKSEIVTQNDFSGLKETEEKVDDGVRVTVNSSGLNSWNMFKVDNAWFNADISMAKAIRAKVGNNAPTIYPCFGMTDEQFSVSRLSYHNEEILGIYPMAIDDIISSFRDTRDIMYIDKTTDARLSDDVAKFFYGRFGDKFGITFSQLDMFNSFVLSKNMLFRKFYEQKLTSFSNYDIIVVPEIQTVFFYNLR